MPLTKKDDSRVPNYYNATGCDEGNNIKSFAWDNGGICFDNNPFCWDDVAIVVELAASAAASAKVIGTHEGWLGAYEKLDDEKKKRFIYLVAKVKGEPDLYKGKKEVKDIKLSAKDIKLTCETITKTVEILEVK